MNSKRLGLAAVVLSLGAMSACSTWNDLTSRATGNRDSTTREGIAQSNRGGPMNARMPTFQTYNECRAWMTAQGSSPALNQGSWQGGEITPAGSDPCQYYLTRS